MKVRRSSVGMIVALSLVTVASCSVGGGGSEEPTSTDLSVKSEHTRASTAVAMPEGWEEVASIDLPYRQIGSPSIEGDLVAFTYPDPDRVDAEMSTNAAVLNWRTGKVHTLAETQFPEGKIDWIGLRDGWVIYADEDRVPWVKEPVSEWRLYVQEATGMKARREIANSGAEATWPPVPYPGENGFTWAELEDRSDPRKGLRVRTWSIGDEQPNDTLRRAKLTMPHPVGQGLLYHALSDTMVDGRAGSDLFLRERGTGDLRQLTNRGLLLDFDVDGDLVVWTERKHPRGNPSAPRNPRAIYAGSLSGPWEPELIYRGSNDGNVVAGSSGFVAFWKDNGRLHIARPGEQAIERIPGPPNLPMARPDASGDLLTYVTEVPEGVRIHVVRVAESGE